MKGKRTTTLFIIQGVLDHKCTTKQVHHKCTTWGTTPEQVSNQEPGDSWESVLRIWLYCTQVRAEFGGVTRSQADFNFQEVIY